MPGQHAKLSPSAAERWIECPASIRMAAKMPPEEESPYAAEGTAAHALAELKASYEFGMITKKLYVSRRNRWRRDFAVDEAVELEMDIHTDAYVALLKERMLIHPHSQLMLEQRLETGLPDGGKGTSDAVIVSPVHIEIVDFKYGAGVAVEAEGNPQLKLYGGGALDKYGDLLGDTEEIRLTVHQPRMDHVLTASMHPDDLRAWRADVAIPVGEVALGPDAPFGPSLSACRWCPASGRCAAQVRAAFPDDLDEVDPDLVTPEQLAELLPRLPEVKQWMTALEAAALHSAYSQGVKIPGWKVVRSGGKRGVKDHDAGLDVLIEAGYEQDDVASVKLKGVGDLEKLLGKERFAELLEVPGIVAKGGGSESLVPESDKRPSITPNQEASAAFDDIEE